MSSGPGLPNPFGRYIPIRRIGVGGMAEVYLAEAVGPGGFKRQVALKVVLPHLSRDETFTQMFLAEARVTAEFTHPNIVQVYDFGVEQDRYYLAMEYAEGRSLSAVLSVMHQKHERPPDQMLAAIGVQACAGLAYAHSRTDPAGTNLGIVHRDISPGNLFLTDTGFIKLLDFGIAKATAEDTDDGVIKGKPSYMSPEQIRDVGVDGRTDVWALGATLWEAAAGEQLYDAGQPLETMKKVIDESPRQLLDLVGDIEPSLAEIVMAMLQKNRDERFTAQDAERSFDHHIHMSGSSNAQQVLQRFLSGDLQPKPIRAYTATPMPGEAPETEQLGDAPTDTWSPPELTTPAPTPTGLTSPAASPSGADDPFHVPDYVPQSSKVNTGEFRASAAIARPPVDNDSLRAAAKWIALAAVAGVLVVVAIAFGPGREDDADGLEAGREFWPLRVESVPSGASIAVDGEQTGKVTPALVQLARTGGMHRVTLTLRGWETTSRSIRQGSVKDGRLRLRLSTRVRIETHPPGARVFLDGKEVLASTPGEVVLRAGKRRLRAVLPGHLSGRRKLVVKPGASWNHRFLRAAFLEVTSNPTGAYLFVDGKDTGKSTPTGRIELEPKTFHTVQARGNLLESREKRIRMGGPGSVKRVKLQLFDPIAAFQKKLAVLVRKRAKLDRQYDQLSSQIDGMFMENPERELKIEAQLRSIGREIETIDAKQQTLEAKIRRIQRTQQRKRQ